MTFSEVKLWNELKNGKMMGYDFDRPFFGRTKWTRLQIGWSGAGVE